MDAAGMPQTPCLSADSCVIPPPAGTGCFMTAPADHLAATPQISPRRTDGWPAYPPVRPVRWLFLLSRRGRPPRASLRNAPFWRFISLTLRRHPVTLAADRLCLSERVPKSNRPKPTLCSIRSVPERRWNRRCRPGSGPAPTLRGPHRRLHNLERSLRPSHHQRPAGCSAKGVTDRRGGAASAAPPRLPKDYWNN